MKRMVFSLILSLIFFSCSKGTEEVVEEKFPDGTPKLVRVYETKEGERILIKETEYYPNHFKKMEGEFKEGKRHGKWIVWYDNGNPWSEGHYKNGKRNGKSITWFENGKMRYEGKYKDDLKVGIWKFYDEQGNFVKSVDVVKENK